jgi:hypothetical protein
MHFCDDEWGEMVVCGKRELGDGDIRGLKVREEKIYRVWMYCTPTTRAWYHYPSFSSVMHRMIVWSYRPTCGAVGAFSHSWYRFLRLILWLFNPCIWSVESIIRSLVFFVHHLPFDLLIISWQPSLQG